MVNEHEENDVELDVTNDEDVENEEIELEEIEEKGSDKIKKLKAQLKEAEEEKRKIQDELQRTKADFLNARRRIEEERALDKVRHKKRHAEELLPLCDSFHMAMSNKEVWEKADKSWRGGIEGIYNQLTRLLESYGVTSIDPTGEDFNPATQEAVGTVPVDKAELQDKVITTLQLGYQIKDGERTEMIRPARVTTGEHSA